jgi:phage terminase small subunit
LPESERPAVKDEHWPFGTQPPAEPPKATDLSELTPLDYLLSVMRDLSADEKVRLQAAQLAAPYVHSRPAPGGKKAARQEAAGKASVTSKFAPGAPPKLSMVK